MRMAQTMKDLIFAAACIGAVLCVLSVALFLQEEGTRWAFGWIAGIALVGVSIGIVLGRRG